MSRFCMVNAPPLGVLVLRTCIAILALRIGTIVPLLIHVTAIGAGRAAVGIRIIKFNLAVIFWVGKGTYIVEGGARGCPVGEMLIFSVFDECWTCTDALVTNKVGKINSPLVYL
jgi:hypothetical protein